MKGGMTQGQLVFNSEQEYKTFKMIEKEILMPRRELERRIAEHKKAHRARTEQHNKLMSSMVEM